MTRSRRNWPFILVALLLAMLGLWRWKASTENDTLWERIRESGRLRVGMDASFPPFEAISESGEFSGYDVELAKELGRRLNLEATFVNISFDGLYDALLDGKCDLIVSALPYNRDLTQDVAYSASYFDAGQVLLALREAGDLGAKDALKGKKVAAELGSEGHFVALEMNRQKAGLEILSAYTLEEALALVRGRQAEALILDRVSALIYSKRYGELQISSRSLSDEPFVIAAPLSSPGLLRQINQALETLKREGFLDTLAEEWIR
jgi:ABC-type amino acid transport substrate-binding protein